MGAEEADPFAPSMAEDPNFLEGVSKQIPGSQGGCSADFALKANGASSPEDPSHGHRARLHGHGTQQAKVLARHQAVFVGKTNLAKLGRSWSISAAWPIPCRLGRDPRQSRQSSISTTFAWAGGPELAEYSYFAAVFCAEYSVLRGIEGSRALRARRPSRCERDETMFRIVRVSASQRPSHLALPRESIITKNGFR